MLGLQIFKEFRFVLRPIDFPGPFEALPKPTTRVQIPATTPRFTYKKREMVNNYKKK